MAEFSQNFPRGNRTPAHPWGSDPLPTHRVTVEPVRVLETAIYLALNGNYEKQKHILRTLTQGKFPLESAAKSLAEAVASVTDVSPAVNYLKHFAAEFALGIAAPVEHQAGKNFISSIRELINSARREGAGYALAGPQPGFRAWVRSVSDEIVHKCRDQVGNASAAPLSARLLLLSLSIDPIASSVLGHPDLGLPKDGTRDPTVERACYESVIRTVTAEVARGLGWLPKSGEEQRQTQSELSHIKIISRKLTEIEPHTGSFYVSALANLAYLRQFTQRMVDAEGERFSLPELQALLPTLITRNNEPFQEAVLPQCPVVVVRTFDDLPYSILTKFDAAHRSASISMHKDIPRIGQLTLCSDGSVYGAEWGNLMPEQVEYEPIKPFAYSIYRSAYSDLETLWEAYPEVYSTLRGGLPVVLAKRESRFELLLPMKIFTSLSVSIPLSQATDPDSQNAAENFGKPHGEPYVAAVLPLPSRAEEFPQEAHEEPLSSSPSHRDLRASIRAYFTRHGRPNLNQFIETLQAFKVWEDRSAGKGSHGALFHETPSGIHRATLCSSIRDETKPLPFGVIWDTLDALEVSLEDYWRSLSKS